MTTQVFSRKLDTLPSTLELFGSYKIDRFVASLEAGAKRHVLSIGSGGSAIAAEYLARCRDSLGFGPTTVQTPMQVVLDQQDLTESDVWLFSAGADNPDAVAASHAALDRRARSVNLVTCNHNGAAGGTIERGEGHVHVVPVADRKDGYLATHSLLSSIVGILLACDAASRDSRGSVHILNTLASRLTHMRDLATRTSRATSLSPLRPSDTVVIANDPLLRPTAVLFDTSIWEASLCHVQTVDFRNLAHGRHTWLHHRMDETFVLALTGNDSRPVWDAMEILLPTPLLRHILDFGSCGRLENALSLIDGLGILEAMGSVLGIDPGKPGIGEFGRLVYEDRSLEHLANSMPANVRHKRAAIAKSDAHDPLSDPLDMIARSRMEALSHAEIGGAVFDYDGTIVTTAGRWSVPNQAIVEELLRLHRAGLVLGFATGRGGSAGEDLREVLPAEMLPSITIGYYNGGHIRTADVDIEFDQPPANPAITETAEWLRQQRELFLRHKFKHREVQITIDMDWLRKPQRFPIDMSTCPTFANRKVRVSGSGHSYDIVPVTSSKLAVVEALRSQVPLQTEVLCLGDSGSRTGNDYALLSHRLGISVGEVCEVADGCWSLFGSDPIGPEALLKILRALIPYEHGRARLDITSLGLDRR